MSNPGYKRLTVALAIACLGLAVSSGFFLYRYQLLSIRVFWACQQSVEFHATRLHALRSDAATAAWRLKNLVVVYPSLIRKDTNSPLDKMVAGERAFAVRGIIEYLRARTGEDLGENPEPWIQKYCPN